MVGLGIIGGSGIYHIDELADSAAVEVDTPFGRPSGPLRTARIGETDVCFLARHGPGHVYSPSEVPYRANVYALKMLGVTHLLSLSAVGSLREDLPPRTLVLPDQIIDRTVSRKRTFFEDGVVAHVGLADPFCACWKDAIAEAAHHLGGSFNRGGTYLCIEGPQFSTRAESNLYRSWGAAVIGMTAMPEARLAREAELCYAVLAMVTDFDVWHDTEEDVTVDVVIQNLRANSATAMNIVRQIAERGLPERNCTCGSALDRAIMTAPELIPEDAADRLRLLAADRLQSH